MDYYAIKEETLINTAEAVRACTNFSNQNIDPYLKEDRYPIYFLESGAVTIYYVEYVDGDPVYPTLEDGNISQEHGEYLNIVAFSYDWNDSGLVPTLYKSKHLHDPDVWEPLHWVGRASLFGETFDKWEKYDFEREWGQERGSKSYFYTDVIVQEEPSLQDFSPAELPNKIYQIFQKNVYLYL